MPAPRFISLTFLVWFLTSGTLLAAENTAPSAMPAHVTKNKYGSKKKRLQHEHLTVVGHSLEDTLPEHLARSGVKVDVVRAQAIRNGNYVDVAQALSALAPSMSVALKNGPFDYADVSLMGSRTEDVLWLVDGVRINNRLYGSTPPLDTLPAAIVDRIEILDGGQSLFYGTQAVAGAVNIVTRPFSDHLTGQITASGDSNTGRHLDGYLANAIGKHRFVVYASGDGTDGYRAFRKQDYQPSATHRDRKYSVYTVGAKYNVDITSKLNLTATYQHTIANLDYARPYRVAKNTNDRVEDLATLKLDFHPLERLNFYVKGYYHNWDTHYDTIYNDLEHPGQRDVLYRNAYWGYEDYGVNVLGRAILHRGLEAWFGYDMQRYGGQDNVLRILPQTEMTNAGFAQLRMTPDLLPHAHIAAGFRYNSPTTGRSATIWNVVGRYDLPFNLYARGEVGTNFRLPTAEELFADDPQDERGNPNLKPERSLSANFSLGQRLQSGRFGIHWDLTGFVRRIDNLIDYTTFDEKTGQEVFGNENGTVHVNGVSISGGMEFNHSFSWDTAFTWNHARQNNGLQMVQIPRSLVKTSLDYHPKDLPFGLTATFVYTGSQYISVSGQRINYGNYPVLNVSGRYYIDKERRHTLNFSIQNLTGAEYGRPSRGCKDTSADGPYGCSLPYRYVSLGWPRTFQLAYTYRF